MTDLPVTDANGKVLTAHIRHHGNYGRSFTPDLALCRCNVSDGGRWATHHQCSRKATTFRICDDGHGRIESYGFCKTHDPVSVYAKRRAADQAMEKKWERERLARTRQSLMPQEFEAALRAIKNGHNDARQCAADVHVKWGCND